MRLQTIIFFVVIILLIIVVMYYVKKDIGTVTGIVSAETAQTIPASTLQTSSSTATDVNFTYYCWFYIDDWTYNYGKRKILFARMSADPNTGSSGGTPPITYFSVDLDNTLNDLSISIRLNCGDKQSDNVACQTSGKLDINKSFLKTFYIPQIAIQNWNLILCTSNGSSLDCYLNGKLSNTFILPSTIFQGNSGEVSNSSIYITPLLPQNGTQAGFSGWTSKFSYKAKTVDPEMAWKIYTKGYGGSMLSNMNYKVSLSVINGSQTVSSVSL